MSKREHAATQGYTVCARCNGAGFIWYTYGYDTGYGFPEEQQEPCPDCKSATKAGGEA